METTKNKLNSKRITGFLTNNAIIVGIVLVAIIVSILRPNFISESNFRNLISNTAIRFIIALGVSGCLITKGTDLSAGRLAGFAACLSAIFLQRGDYGDKFYKNLGELPIIVVLLGVLAVCAVVGIANGCVISFFKVPPFIATLGMQTLVYGICLVYTGAKPIGGLRNDYTKLATGYLENQTMRFIVIGAAIAILLLWIVLSLKSAKEAGTKFNILKAVVGTICVAALIWVLVFKASIISYVFIIAAAIGFYMWFLYNKTRHGKYMYAIGGNESAAEVAGVNCNKTKILIYMLAAILYGVTGFLMAAKSGGASVNTAMGYELEAIAGCTIGGVSTNGGVGKVSGILIGVLVFELLKIAMQFMGIETSYTYIVQGLVIIVAVALDLRKYLAKK